MTKRRFGTLVIVFAAGVLLQLSVVVSSAISVYRSYLQAVLPDIEFVWHWADLGISFGVVTTLFAMVYKWLSDAKVAWRDVWDAALITALLFSAGKYAIAFYTSPTAVFSPCTALLDRSWCCWRGFTIRRSSSCLGPSSRKL